MKSLTSVIANKITAKGAKYLNELISADYSALKSIELLGNILENEGIIIIVSSETSVVQLEHIGLQRNIEKHTLC